MSQHLNITDFLKPFTQASPAKRSAPDNNLQDSELPRKSRSASPRITQHGIQTPDLHGDNAEQRASTRTKPIPDTIIESLTQKGPDAIINYVGMGTAQEPNKARLGQADLPSSQGPLTSSSQRIVKNGQVVIRGSDDEDSDSEASLGNIDELLRSRKMTAGSNACIIAGPDSSPLTSAGSVTPELEAAPTRHTRRANGATKFAHPNTISPRTRHYRFDLGSLVERNEQDEISEAGLSNAKIRLEHMERNDGVLNRKPQGIVVSPRAIDPQMIASAMNTHGAGSDASRLLLAIQRTDALQIETSWSFFDAEDEPEEYPVSTAPMRDDFLQESHLHQQAFLGGNIGEVAANSGLPDEVVFWLVNAVCSEPRKDLRHAYRHTLKDIPTEVSSALDSPRIDALFQKVGARHEALNTEELVVPVMCASSRHKVDHHRPRLKSLVQFLNDMAAYLQIPERIHTTCLLCRLLLDKTIDYSTTLAIEETFVKFIDFLPADDGDASLRSQLIQKLPAFSSQLALLRRRLSLAFFFESPDLFRKPQSELVDLPSVSRRLASPKYNITRDANFAEIAAMISLLNVGIDCADTSLAHLDQAMNKKFNDEVDELSRTVKSISNQIIDTRVSQMKKTEAKETLEDLHFRLMHTVRTRPKPKVLYCDIIDADGNLMKQKSMKHFIRKPMSLEDSARLQIKGEVVSGQNSHRH